MRKLIIHPRKPYRKIASPQVLPPESRPQTVVVHHYHHAQQTRAEEPSSGCAGYVLAILLPAVGFIVGIVFLCLPGRGAQGLRIILLSILASTLYAVLYFFALSVFLSRSIP